MVILSCKIVSLIFILTPVTVRTVSRMKELYNWKRIDYHFENETHRQLMIESGQFVPGNAMPTSFALWTDKMFFALPRFKLGIPASLAYITVNLTEAESNTTPPFLIPYPNWGSHDITARNITSVLNINIDVCDHLWIIDSGQIENKYEIDPTLIIFDLKSSSQLEPQKIKSKTDYRTEPYLADIIVDVTSATCDNAYAYIADAANYELIVYSLRFREFHKLSHNYFHFDPLCGDLNIDGVHYQTQYGIFSLAVSPVGRDDHRTLYFNPYASAMQFAVSTRVVQNKTLDMTKGYYEFKLMGSRGTNAQSSASSFDEETGVLFYTLISRNAIGCWNSFSGDEYNENSQGIIMEEERLIYPSDVEVDTKGKLWCLSNRLPRHQNGHLNDDEVNIRIFRGSIRSIIKGTICDAM